MPFLNTKSGNIYYEVIGEGEPLIFVHGRTLDHRMWLNQVEYFKTKYKCIVYDLSGFGKSEVPDDGYSRGDTLFELVNYLEIPKSVFIGLSLGSHVILELAIKHPELFSKMVLMSPAVPGMNLNGEFLRDWEKIELASKSKNFALAKKYWKESKVFNTLKSASPKNYELFSSMIADYNCWDLDSAPKSKPFEVNVSNDYLNIRINTLILFGALDYSYFIDNSRFLNTQISNSKLVEISNSGHMINLEFSDYINQLVDGFLDS